MTGYTGVNCVNFSSNDVSYLHENKTIAIVLGADQFAINFVIKHACLHNNRITKSFIFVRPYEIDLAWNDNL